MALTRAFKNSIKLHKRSKILNKVITIKYNPLKVKINYVKYWLETLWLTKENFYRKIFNNVNIVNEHYINNLKNSIVNNGKILFSIKEKTIKLENSLFEIKYLNKKFIDVKIRYYGFLTLVFFPFYKTPKESRFFKLLVSFDQFLFKFKLSKALANWLDFF